MAAFIIFGAPAVCLALIARISEVQLVYHVLAAGCVGFQKVMGGITQVPIYVKRVRGPRLYVAIFPRVAETPARGHLRALLIEIDFRWGPRLCGVGLVILWSIVFYDYFSWREVLQLPQVFPGFHTSRVKILLTRPPSRVIIYNILNPLCSSDTRQRHAKASRRLVNVEHIRQHRGRERRWGYRDRGWQL